MEKEATPQSPKPTENDSDLKDGKIRIELVYDMTKGTLSMKSGAPEIMILGVLTQAVTMVGQKQVLKTLNAASKKSLLYKEKTI